MYSDITRDTSSHATELHISRLLMQQGRVLLDADWNLQVAVFWRYLRALAADIIGPHGGTGFSFTRSDNNITIGQGHYYVNGILCENGSDSPYQAQLQAGTYLACLDAWEQSSQDDYFREKALNGVDTTTRVQIAWQIRALAVDSDFATELDRLVLLRQSQTAPRAGGEVEELYKKVQDYLDSGLMPLSRATMRARIDPEVGAEDPCILPPASRYRGNENQLYRVEIHKFGEQGEATFKWSRDNGSVATAWLGIADGALRVESVRGFNDGQWVELTYDGADRGDTPPTLVKIVKVEDDKLTFDPQGITPEFDSDYQHPLVRRWDQTDNDQISLEDGTIPVEKGLPTNWIDLENGIQIQFDNGGTYRTGDYWLIPARTAGGQIEWPQNGSPNGVFQPPHGVLHSYAPLARIIMAGEDNVTSVEDLRRLIIPIAQ